MRKTHTQKIKELEAQLNELKKEIKGKYKPVICNGLMWSEVAEDEMTWDEAMDYVKKLKEGGYKDWRLPTNKELVNIFNYQKGRPEIDFRYTSNFWSSTEYSSDATNAWYVYLNRGHTGNSTKTNTNAVRCVRRVKGNLSTKNKKISSKLVSKRRQNE